VIAKLREIFWRETGDHHSVLWLFLVNDVLGSFIFPARIRTQLIRLFIPGIDRRAIIRAGVIFKSSNVRIGPGSLISYRVLFDTREGVQLGRHVSVGADARFVTSDHALDDPDRRSGAGIGAPIVVGDGARVALNSTVLKGVTIGAGAVVGASSLVTRDCDPHTLYLGVPAKAVRALPV
jgi:maltose O-acetyltransferase